MKIRFNYLNNTEFREPEYEADYTEIIDYQDYLELRRYRRRAIRGWRVR